MFNIGDKLTKENYTKGAIWCNNNDATIEIINGEYVIVAIPEPAPLTRDEVTDVRRRLYIEQVDPITAHINRLRDEELTAEVAAEIAALVEERKALVAKIKEENPYPVEEESSVTEEVVSEMENAAEEID